MQRIEMLQRLFFAHVDTAIFLFLTCQFQHLLLYGLQILVRQHYAVTGFDVIIKTVFDSRTDTEFGVRIKLLQRFRHQMRGRVPKSVFPLLVIPCVQLDFRILYNRARQIPSLSIHGDCQHFLCQLRANRFRDVKAGNPCLELLYISIRKLNLDHKL